MTATSDDMQPFEIAGPLPTVGTTLLEASAGTGKTWAIAALVTRLVAEGAAELDDLLVVTFGRAASAELKDRMRERLVEADAALAGGLSTHAGRLVNAAVGEALDLDVTALEAL